MTVVVAVRHFCWFQVVSLYDDFYLCVIRLQDLPVNLHVGRFRRQGFSFVMTFCYFYLVFFYFDRQAFARAGAFGDL